MTSPRVITESLGGSALSLAAQQGKLPASMQPWRPRSIPEWKAHVERRRAQPNGWFDRLKPALSAGGAAAERLTKVVEGRGVVVTTGQQPGLFGGPVYTLSKAITALELANAIEKTTGVPATAIFWAATDDADFAEASVASLADGDGLHELSQTQRPPAGTPMADAALEDLSAQIERLRAACGSAPHEKFLKDAVVAYTTQKTVGDAYVMLMRSLLEPLGIAVLDASHAAQRAAARPTLADALKGAEEISKHLAERAAEIVKAGFEPQVEDDRGLSLVFAMEKGIKRRLTVAEAATFSANVELIPNVLLRPLVEREILPTVAYVAGPGEISYFAQADAVASALGRDRLSVVPRWSCTIVEPFVERALGRLNVQMAELKDIHAVEKRLARAALPEPVAQAWQKLTDQVQAAVKDLARAVEDAKLMPPPVIEGLSRSLSHRLSRSERRLLAAAKRKDDAVRRDLAAAAAALWPRGNRQERVLNFIPMLARGGDALLAEMRRAAGLHAAELIGK